MQDDIDIPDGATVTLTFRTDDANQARALRAVLAVLDDLREPDGWDPIFYHHRPGAGLREV